MHSGLAKANVVSCTHLRLGSVWTSHAFTQNTVCFHCVCAVSFQTAVVIALSFLYISISTEHFLQVSVSHLMLPDYISTLMSARFVTAMTNLCCRFGCRRILTDRLL
jgi:hypothetical protein